MNRIGREQMQQLLKSIPSNYLTMELNGEELQTWEQYSLAIEKNMCFPTTCVNSIDRYNDWIRDLEWLDAKGYVIVIYNFAKFMERNLIIKDIIINGFKDFILPWWEGEVEKCTPCGKITPFNVYLVD